MLLSPHLIDREPMRLILALLFVAATVGLAGAQGTPQGTPKRMPQTAVPPAPSQVAPKEIPNEKDEVLRQRLLLKERFNKGWDIQIENAQDPARIAGRCKAEAKRHYSALHPIKRRKFVQDCIARKRG